jgi:hypothetical protein
MHATPWIVQLHRGAVDSGADRTNMIVAGDPENGWVDFDVRRGIEELREEVRLAGLLAKGIRLIGEFGITSHFGDIVRKAGVPAIKG